MCKRCFIRMCDTAHACTCMFASVSACEWANAANPLNESGLRLKATIATNAFLPKVQERRVQESTGCNKWINPTHGKKYNYWNLWRASNGVSSNVRLIIEQLNNCGVFCGHVTCSFLLIHWWQGTSNNTIAKQSRWWWWCPWKRDYSLNRPVLMAVVWNSRPKSQIQPITSHHITCYGPLKQFKCTIFIFFAWIDCTVNGLRGLKQWKHFWWRPKLIFLIWS